MTKCLNVQVTILILIDGFLQYCFGIGFNHYKDVTILILIDGFLQCIETDPKDLPMFVTILILIDGFLQYMVIKNENKYK